MRKIPLSNGEFTLVNDEDYEYLNQWKWKRHTGGYASRSTVVHRKYVTVLMHREVLGAESNEEVHHINENKLDNRRDNLAIIDTTTHRKRHSNNIVAYQKKHQKYPDYKYCIECGKLFKVNPRKRKRQKTCCKECAQKIRVRGMMKARGVW